MIIFFLESWSTDSGIPGVTKLVNNHGNNTSAVGLPYFQLNIPVKGNNDSSNICALLVREEE